MKSILPDLSFSEMIEVIKIQSVSGALKNLELTQRPFRSPHHTITKNGLIGGGNPPKIGEISLAHLGVLYLDEILEYKKDVIDQLREPLEEKQINISRVGRNIIFPCNFTLLASANPCPCGYYGSKKNSCKCTPSKIKNYRSKLSGPMIDRFDMVINVSEIDKDEVRENNSELSSEIRKRVNKARKIQSERYKDESIFTNSELSNSQISKHCIIEESAKDILNKSFDNLKFSMRAYYKIIKVARTIADIEESKVIKKAHLLEAMQYRSKENGEL